MRVVGLFDVRSDDEGRPRRPYSYRADLLHDFVDLRVLTPASHRLHTKIRDVFEHRLHMPMDLALRSQHLAKESDVVFAFLESFAVFPSALKARNISAYKKRPLIALSCWWAEEIATGNDEQRSRIKQALEGIDAIICFSQNQQEVFAKLGYPATKVYSVPFGVDPDFYSPDPSEAKTFEVVSAGVDRGRDYATLMRVAEILPHRTFDIFTQPGRINDPPPNVRVHSSVDIDTHRDNLRRAQLVVVPTHDLQYPTGQSVLLESMACGTPTAVTETAAMQEYIRDDEWNFSLPLQDSTLFAKKLDDVLSSPARRDHVARGGRAQVESSFNFRKTWEAVFEVFEDTALKFTRR